MAKRRRKKAAGRRPSLSRLSASDLLHELSRRGSEIQQMRQERQQLVDRIAEIDETLGMLGERTHAPRSPGRRPGRPAGRRASGRSPAARTRAANSMTLEQAMYKTLKGKTMGVQELAQAVKSGGYKTNAENFRTMVNQTLLRSEHFKKVARGQYTTA
ncbi:MAG: hypothetical protein H6811_09135 [Phycisphaeraceae bacterium]|nr:hypothetical protein [Phycisphaeraceae bacterium]